MAKAAWLAGEAAILATALAELVGGAIALRLLFGLPLLGGVAVTGVGTFAVLALTRGNADRHERVIAVLLAIVAASFVFCCSRPIPPGSRSRKASPGPAALRDPQGFLIALGILGATLMPHNLYLHSGSLAERARSLPADARDIAMRVARNDTALSLGVAMLINAAIMIVAAASLSGPGLIVSSLDDAHAAIGHTLGGRSHHLRGGAVCRGQSSTITGVLAGRIPSRGFQAGSNWSDRRRALATRLIAGAAAAGLLGYSGGQDPDGLLVLSQVILSLALPFALAPLVLLACRKSIMGRHRCAAPGPGLPSRPPSASSRWMAICWPIPCCNAASARNRVMATKTPASRWRLFTCPAGGVPIGRNHRMVPASGIHVMQHLAQGAAEGRHAQLQPPPGLASEGPVRQGLRLDGFLDQGPFQLVGHACMLQRGIAHDSLPENSRLGTSISPC